MYGLKYTCTFDPVVELSNIPVYTIEILQKSYTGEVFSITGGTVPALQNWETDDPKAPIKGSSLTMAFINKDGALPLSNFFSTNDDEFKVRLKYLGNVLFEGFLVQDDCNEPLLDYTHEINLSANDNLGLLKSTSLDKANIFSLLYTSPSVGFGADFPSRMFLFGADIQPYMAVGNRIEITGTSIDGTYTINKIVIDPTGTVGLFVDEPIPQSYIGNTIYKMYTPANLLNKTPLSIVLQMCLSVTGLELNTNVYSQINEVSQDPTKCFLEQTLIDPQTFLKSDTEYTDCYDVLTKILSRFNMTLFQANGAWNIVRWDELRYFNNLIQGFSYDKDFNSLGVVTLPAISNAGIDENSQAETGILQKINRPFLFDKQTFNYQYPRQLLRNFDLQQLGSQIRTYTKNVWISADGVVHESDPGGFGVVPSYQTYTEYNMPWWTINTPTASGEVFIRVITDALGNEIDRFAVCKGFGGNLFGSPLVKSYPIEVNAGDTFTLSFQFRTQDSQNNVNLFFWVQIDNGGGQLYFHNPANTTGSNVWQTQGGFLFYIDDLDNSNQWHTVTVDASYHPFPNDALLYVFLSGVDLYAPYNECQYKDIKFDYVSRVNQSTKIIGQTHLQSQSGVIKNNEDVEIFVDSSPRNSIAGTLFLNEKVGLLQKRTEYWRHPYKPTQKVKLGDLITYEQLFWRRVPRTILEGTLYGLISGGAHISLLSVFKYSLFPDLNFVFGKMEIDYKNNKVDGTLWEIWNDEESEANLPDHYIFNYLYSTT